MRASLRLWTLMVMLATGPALAQQSPVFAAMRDELQRSMTGLRLDGQPAPYYIAYQLDDVAARRHAARLGEVLGESSTHSRVLRVEVRVGDYAFDSSNFFTTDRRAGVVSGESLAAPLDDDYDVMRRQIWLLTDAAYKRAVETYARKKASYQNRSDAERIPDFGKAPPLQRPESALPVGSTWSERASQVLALSSLFTRNPELAASEINLVEEQGRRYFVNSEGTRLVIPIGVSGVRVTAEAQAPDGATVRDGFEVYGRTLDDLPSAVELQARVSAFIANLEAARTASIGEEYTGPVLFEGVAGAELVARVLVPALLAARAPEADNAALERSLQGLQGQRSSFLNRIGSRVMADELSISDTPSLRNVGARTVPGAYDVDDEGVTAQDVTLVDKGKLVTLLSDRTPVRNIPQSNGHGRGGGPQAGVVQVKSSAAVPAAMLKADYLQLLKSQGRPFGYIVHAMPPGGALAGTGLDPVEVLGIAGQTGSSRPTGPLITQLVRVSPDGQEQVVRSMRFAALTPNLFRDVLGASEELQLHTIRADPAVALGATTMGRRAVPVSVIAPQFIVDDLEIQRVRDAVQKQAVVPSPLKP